VDQTTSQVLIAAIGVLGVLIAAVATQWLSKRADEDRWRREQSVRWLSDRKQTFVSVARWAEEVYRESVSAAADDEYDLSSRSGLADLRQACYEVRLTSPDVDDAAGDLYNTIRNLFMESIPPDRADGTTLDALREEYRRKLDAFFRAAQRSLGTVPPKKQSNAPS
jgi:hypothetical protein